MLVKSLCRWKAASFYPFRLEFDEDRSNGSGEPYTVCFYDHVNLIKMIFTEKTITITHIRLSGRAKGGLVAAVN